MKSKIYVVSETMEESQVVSGILLKIIDDHKIDAEIVSVTSGQYFDQMSICIPAVTGDPATVFIQSDLNSMPIHVVTGINRTSLDCDDCLHFPCQKNKNFYGSVEKKMPFGNCGDHSEHGYQ